MFTLKLFFVSLIGLSLCKEKIEPLVITEDNWGDLLQGEWLVKFYAPWCPACKSLAPTWLEVAKWSDDLEMNVAHIDVTENPGLSGRFLVTALPTIYHVKDGVFRQYSGSRESKDLVAFVDEKKWQDVQPPSWLMAPTSPVMAALGWFFRFSMTIRNVHTLITESYGIPEWASYVIFAIATIVSGLILGLCVVCLCDVFFPPPKHPAPVKTYTPRVASEKDDDSDCLVDDRPSELQRDKKKSEQSDAVFADDDASVRQRRLNNPTDTDSK